MFVSFFTLGPVNNKGFIIGLIPRLVEGAAARYVTGSGETLQTRDRVKVFCTEGNFEKPKRATKRARIAIAKTISFFSDEGSDNIAAFMLSSMSTPRSSQESSLSSPHETDSSSAETSDDPSEEGPYRIRRIDRPLSSSDVTSASACSFSSSGVFPSSPTIPASTSWIDPNNKLGENQFLVSHDGPIRVRSKAKGKGKCRGRKGRGKGMVSSTISNLSFIVSSPTFCEDEAERNYEATDVAEQLLRLRLSCAPRENAALVSAAVDCSL
jgi:hypothetical protein